MEDEKITEEEERAAEIWKGMPHFIKVSPENAMKSAERSGIDVPEKLEIWSRLGQGRQLAIAAMAYAEDRTIEDYIKSALDSTLDSSMERQSEPLYFAMFRNED